jgi:hypothetical protein
MQGGFVTLADEMYCFGRQFQFLASAGEFAVLAKLEKRFARLEMPLFILALVFHPMYAKVGRAMIDAGVFNVMTLTDWVNAYGNRWGHGAAAGSVSAALSIQEWSWGFDGWVTHISGFGGEAGKHWNFILSSSPAASSQTSVKSRRLLAQVAKKLFGVLPNAADPERVISELGRMITPSRTSLTYAPSTRMIFIAANCRAQQREIMGGGGNESTMHRSFKKFYSRAEAILRLRSIGKNPVAVVSDVPHGAVVEMGLSSPLAGSSQDEPMVEAAGEGEPAEAIEPTERGEAAEGVDAGDAARRRKVWTRAMRRGGGRCGRGRCGGADRRRGCLFPVNGGAHLLCYGIFRSVAASGLDADDLPITILAAGVDTDDAKWDKYPLGQQPDENDPDVPLDTMAGFRSMAGPWPTCSTSALSESLRQ